MAPHQPQGRVITLDSRNTHKEAWVIREDDSIYFQVDEDPMTQFPRLVRSLVGNPWELALIEVSIVHPGNQKLRGLMTLILDFTPFTRWASIARSLEIRVFAESYVKAEPAELAAHPTAKKQTHMILESEHSLTEIAFKATHLTLCGLIRFDEAAEIMARLRDTLSWLQLNLFHAGDPGLPGAMGRCLHEEDFLELLKELRQQDHITTLIFCINDSHEVSEYSDAFDPAKVSQTLPQSRQFRGISIMLPIRMTKAVLDCFAESQIFYLELCPTERVRYPNLCTWFDDIGLDRWSKGTEIQHPMWTTDELQIFISSETGSPLLVTISQLSAVPKMVEKIVFGSHDENQRFVMPQFNLLQARDFFSGRQPCGEHGLLKIHARLGQQDIRGYLTKLVVADMTSRMGHQRPYCMYPADQFKM